MNFIIHLDFVYDIRVVFKRYVAFDFAEGEFD